MVKDKGIDADRPRVIRLVSSVATRCPLCGKWSLHRVNLFALAKDRPSEIRCECGCQKLAMGRGEKGRFWLEVPCLSCESRHSFEFTLEEFCSKDLKTLLCGSNDVEVGFMGSERQVRRGIRRKEAEACEGREEAGLGEYFEEPDVMYGVLEKLHGLAKGGNLKCPCGSAQIEVDIYPDRLELKCARCSRSAVVQARTMRDLQVVRSLTSLEMSGGLAHGMRPSEEGERRRETSQREVFESGTGNAGARTRKPTGPRSKRGED